MQNSELVLKPAQKSVLAALAERRSVIARLPTGYGKSLCFWYPALFWQWKVVVISPLRSLLEEQASTCRKLGLRILSYPQQDTKCNGHKSLEDDSWDIAFLSPEKLVIVLSQSPSGLRAYADLIVLDEAHCLEDWQTFRGGYRDLWGYLANPAELGVPILMLSASIRRTDALAWAAELKINAKVVEEKLGRGNIFLSLLPLEGLGQKWIALLGAVKNLPVGEKAIVYCASREESEQTASFLTAAGMLAAYFHGGMDSELRQSRDENFRNGSFSILCATSAYGMGVNCPGVRRVIHFSVPYDLSAYWQEVGRAGRDGMPSYAVAFWGRSELMRAQSMLKKQRERYLALWNAWVNGGCIRGRVAEYLQIEYENCSNCSYCRDLSSLPNWLRDILHTKNAAPWWLQKFAEPQHWLELSAEQWRETS